MLVGRVDVIELRAHGDGIQTGQRIGEQAALKAGMDGLDAQLSAKQLAVALLEDPSLGF